MRFKLSFLILFSFSVLIFNMFHKKTYAARMKEEEVVSVISSVGFPPPVVPIMTCIAFYESSFRTNILNRNSNNTVDYGFLQINTIWLESCRATTESILDVYVNARCGLKVYNAQGLTAWVTFNKFRKKCLAYKVKPNKLLQQKEMFVLVEQKVKI